ncbi:MAG TPA: hypothetical protein QGH10_02065, partial [Armatimonadota bacterium]|nr:hypothetical protein [Armatimonadota bacterium]
HVQRSAGSHGVDLIATNEREIIMVAVASGVNVTRSKIDADLQRLRDTPAPPGTRRECWEWCSTRRQWTRHRLETP